MNEGARCSEALQKLEVNSADGRRFQANDDLQDWFEVFGNECLAAVLFSGAPLRLGYLLGRGPPRPSSIGGGAGGTKSRPGGSVSLTGILKPKITPASWDIRGKSSQLLKMERVGVRRPSCKGRRSLSLSSGTLPDPSLEKPRIRPSHGAKGELEMRLAAVDGIYAVHRAHMEAIAARTSNTPALLAATPSRVEELARPRSVRSLSKQGGRWGAPVWAESALTPLEPPRPLLQSGRHRGPQNGADKQHLFGMSHSVPHIAHKASDSDFSPRD